MKGGNLAEEKLWDNKYLQSFLLLCFAFFFFLLIKNFFMANALWMDEALYSMYGENIYQNGRLFLYDDPSVPLVSSPLQMYFIATLFFLFGERFSFLPMLKLSNAVTEQPLATKRSVRCEPMNPAPPVIITRI